jgi:hypothetical protein
VNHRRLASLLVVLGLLSVGACSAPCEEALDVYPPAHIEVTGIETVEVPHISWTCAGFHSDSIDPPPSVVPDSAGRVGLEVSIEDGSTIEVSFGNTPVAVVPTPVAGVNTWSFEVPDPTEPLVVRICSADGACAMYWANLYPGLFG